MKDKFWIAIADKDFAAIPSIENSIEYTFNIMHNNFIYANEDFNELCQYVETLNFHGVFCRARFDLSKFSAGDILNTVMSGCGRPIIPIIIEKIVTVK